jgi:hypothetical protein
MRVPDKIELIRQIASELKFRQYDYALIDALLAGYEIKEPKGRSFNDSFEYSKIALLTENNETILKIAKDLDLDFENIIDDSLINPKNWNNCTDLKLFISHISTNKVEAMRLKDCLVPYHIKGFVAHEDINPTLSWQTEIERALKVMDAFVAIHTDGFSKSVWTQQEIGFAVGRGVKIISLRMGEDPTGFISKNQALPRKNRNAEEIALAVNNLLLDDENTTEKMREAKKAADLNKDLDKIQF